MNRFVINTISVAVAVGLLSYLLPGVEVNHMFDALLVAVVLAILNNIVKPLLIILTIPATILTLGLFLFVINALIIQMAAWVIDGFHVQSFWWALLFSLLLSLLKSLMGYGEKDKKEKR
ncbi:MAG: phage holin family protein [Flavobacteriales bacterium]|nr:phage holin family protein [Flavobacteriales bacterium]